MRILLEIDFVLFCLKMRLFCIPSIARRNISENGALLEISCSAPLDVECLRRMLEYFWKQWGTSGFEVLLEVK